LVWVSLKKKIKRFNVPLVAYDGEVREVSTDLVVLNTRWLRPVEKQ
jgi:hypothetical protein